MDLIIRAFEALCAFSFVGQKEYIPPNEGQNFADILFAEIFKDNISEGGKILGKYIDASRENKNVIQIFSMDIAKEIVKKEDILNAVLIIAPLSVELMKVVSLVIAHAFGDEEEVKRILKREAQ